MGPFNSVANVNFGSNCNQVPINVNDDPAKKFTNDLGHSRLDTVK